MLSTIFFIISGLFVIVSGAVLFSKQIKKWLRDFTLDRIIWFLADDCSMSVDTIGEYYHNPPKNKKIKDFCFIKYTILVFDEKDEGYKEVKEWLDKSDRLGG